MTTTQTREPARPRPTAQSAGSRHHQLRRRARDFLIHLILSAISAAIVVVATAGSFGDVACFIAALSLYPLIAPAHPRPRKQRTEPQPPRPSDMPYDLGRWLQ